MMFVKRSEKICAVFIKKEGCSPSKNAFNAYLPYRFYFLKCV